MRILYVMGAKKKCVLSENNDSILIIRFVILFQIFKAGLNKPLKYALIDAFERFYIEAGFAKFMRS